MLSISSRIWTRVTVSISYDDNHYTTGILTIPGYYCQIHFYTNKQFFFNQFSLTRLHSLIFKTFLFQAIQFSQTVLIQTIQLSIEKQFHFTQFSLAYVRS